MERPILVFQKNADKTTNKMIFFFADLAIFWINFRNFAAIK